MNRHRWSPPHRTENETSRACLRCGLIKVTRHEPGRFPWTEFHRDGLRIAQRPDELGKTPPCEAEAEVDA